MSLMPFEPPPDFGLIKAAEVVGRARWEGFANEVVQVALFRPDVLPVHLIEPMLHLWGLQNLYTDLFDDDFLRRVYAQAHTMNKLRGTQASLNIFRDATTIGYFLDVVRNADGSPASIDLWLANPPGEALDPQQIEYAVQGYESLLPQKVQINRPVGVATEMDSTPKVVALYSEIDLYRVSNF